MLSNVKQVIIAPLIQSTIAPGTLIYTDEYRIYARLVKWGYEHKQVNHGQGEYARDEDGDGFHEVHVNFYRKHQQRRRFGSPNQRSRMAK